MPRKRAGTPEAATENAGDLLARVISAPLDVAAVALGGVVGAVAGLATSTNGKTRGSKAAAPKKRAKTASAKRGAAAATPRKGKIGSTRTKKVGASRRSAKTK
jgi:hypothetical protein